MSVPAVEAEVPAVSFVVTVVRMTGDGGALAGLVASFVALEGAWPRELLIVSKFADPMLDCLEQSSGQHPIRVAIAEGRSRCYRKDLGAQLAAADLVCFVDADCRLAPDYMSALSHVRQTDSLDGQALRGHVEYRPGDGLTGRLLRIYRTLCDDDFFKDRHFTPNLLFRKDVLARVGGWAEDLNLDGQDDFILSDRCVREHGVGLRRVESLRLWSACDEKLSKLVRTWRGYGSGYAYRFYRYGASRSRFGTLRALWTYAPPLVLRSRYLLHPYMPFAVIQWGATMLGYVATLLRLRTRPPPRAELPRAV